MPAIPVYALVQMHLTDEELRALIDVAHDLVRSHAHSMESSPTGHACTAAPVRLNAACTLYAAAMRTLRERNLVA